MPRCRARTKASDGKRLCSRKNQEGSDMCAQHSSFQQDSSQAHQEDECSCCLRAIKPLSNKNIRPHCGHEIHHECLKKWISLQPLAVKSCPTCRTPLCPAIVDLLDDDVEVRAVLSRMKHIRTSDYAYDVAYEYTVADFGALIDMTTSIEYIIKNHMQFMLTFKLSHVGFMFFTYKLIQWTLPPYVAPLPELMRLLDIGKQLTNDYIAAAAKAATKNKTTKRFLSTNGKRTIVCSC